MSFMSFIPLTQSMTQSTQSMTQQSTQSMTQQSTQSMTQSMTELMNESLTQQSTQLMNEPLTQLMNEPLTQLINEPITPEIHYSTSPVSPPLLNLPVAMIIQSELESTLDNTLESELLKTPPPTIHSDSPPGAPRRRSSENFLNDFYPLPPLQFQPVPQFPFPEFFVVNPPPTIIQP